MTAVTAGLDPHLADRMCEADFLWRTTFSDLFLPAPGIPGRTALPGATLAEELDLLDKLTDEQFVDAALEFTCALPYEVPGPAALSDAGLRRRALELAAARGPRQVRFTKRLLADPPRIRAWLRQFLRGLRRGVLRRGLVPAAPPARRGRPPQDGPAAAQGPGRGARLGVLRGDAGRGGRTDHRRQAGRSGRTRHRRTAGCCSCPTSLGWPHLMVLHRYGWQPVLHYPVGSPGAGRARPRSSSSTLRMTALSHPVRMRMCRHLARSAYTTSELAQVHGMTAPEISRHLAS